MKNAQVGARFRQRLTAEDVDVFHALILYEIQDFLAREVRDTHQAAVCGHESLCFGNCFAASKLRIPVGYFRFAVKNIIFFVCRRFFDTGSK